VSLDDVLWAFANWLVEESLLKTVSETPDDERDITTLVRHFRKEKNL